MGRWRLALLFLACTTAAADPVKIRVATFNASLHRRNAGDLADDLAGGEDAQARAAAGIIRRVRPDVILINEFDYDTTGRAAKIFRELYLEPGKGGIAYPHVYAAAVNTGVPSGHDLDNNGRVGGPGDALGFGWFPGQYGMLLLSRLPIETEKVRTFRTFRWRDMPGAMLPKDPATGEAYYSDEELTVLRLSSKSHWDIPVRAGETTVHILASHPTPPVFDGAEDRNGRRNHDEIRLWADYVDPARSDYLVDDAGRRGGLPKGAQFVIVGDLNADPVDGESIAGAAKQVTAHPLVRDPKPESKAAGTDTADFGRVGRVRVDYVLPSRALTVGGSGVFWPAEGEEGHDLIEASDHRLVWVDLEW